MDFVGSNAQSMSVSSTTFKFLIKKKTSEWDREWTKHKEEGDMAKQQ